MNDFHRTVEQICRGDIDAYGELVHAAQDEIWKVALSIPTVSSTPEDIVQDVFAIGYERLREFRGDDIEAFSHWVKQIARNLIRDQLRQQASEAVRHKRYQELQLLRLDDEHELETASQLKVTLQHCRERLGETMRQALALYYEHDYDMDGVGEAIGRSGAAAQKLISRARLQLRECIAQQGESV